jgi:plasmid stabilization system protein ParE
LATEVIWTTHSEFGLKNIFEFIAHDSAFYAARFVNNLVISTNNQLSLKPLSGRSIPEFEGTNLSFLREVIYRGYRVIYDPSDSPDKVFILAVGSGRQELRNINTDWDLD